MSYARDDGYKGAPLKIGLLIATVLVAYVVKPYVSEKGAVAGMGSDEGAERALIGDPEIGATMTLLKTRFPDRYARMRDAVRDKAGSLDMAAIRDVLSVQMIDFQRSERRYLAQAPHVSLAAVRTLHASILADLQPFTPACLGFIDGNLARNAMVSDATRTNIAAFGLKRVAAMADGRDTPAGRPTTPLDAKAATALGEALRARGTSLPALELIDDTRTADQATTETRCEAETNLVGAIDSLTPEQADRAYASFFAGQS